jgi:hypothetical protein
MSNKYNIKTAYNSHFWVIGEKFNGKAQKTKCQILLDIIGNTGGIFAVIAIHCWLFIIN